jgi:hypothetical protein
MNSKYLKELVERRVSRNFHEVLDQLKKYPKKSEEESAKPSIQKVYDAFKKFKG